MKLNKKGFQLFDESILVIFSILIIFLLIFFAKYSLDSSKDQIKDYHLDLNYNYPGVYVKSFLYTNLSSEDQKKFNSENINYVKDLFILDSSEARALIETYRKEYIKDYGVKYHYRFQDFSNNQEYNENQVIFIKYDQSKIDLNDFSKILSQNNFYYFIKDNDGDFSIIYFKNPLEGSYNYGVIY